MPTPSIRTVATGLRFPEGPSLLDDGSIAVVEMQGESVARVASDGAVSVLGDLGGGPNGSVLGSDGAVYVSNNGGLSVGRGGFWHAPREFDGRVQKVDLDGSVGTVVEDLPGPAPHRPNDICFAPDGRLLVTDSADWESLADVGPGRLLAIASDGSVEVLLELTGVPNGLAFTSDGQTLLVAQSMTLKILAVPYAAGRAGQPARWGKLPSGSPDGLCVAADGTVFVCGSLDHSVHVFEADGQLRETLAMPEKSQPTNCCLSGTGDLLVTLARAGSLVAVDVKAEPLALHRGTVKLGALA
jgi:gluconolactonase